METEKSIEGRFKYRHLEVIWIHEDLGPGNSRDTVTRTFGLGLDYTEILTFEDPKAAESQFTNWVMSAVIMTDDQVLALVTSLRKEKDLEETALWNKVVMAAQLAQSAHRTYFEAKHDLGRSSAERQEAERAYAEAKRQLLAALAELKIVKLS